MLKLGKAGPANSKPRANEKHRRSSNLLLFKRDGKTNFLLPSLERILRVLRLYLTAKLCAVESSCCFHCSGGEGVCWSDSEEWCTAVSGWFGLCSVGGQAPVQIKDFSVKVPDSATVMCVCVCVCDWACVQAAGGGKERLGPPSFYFIFFFNQSLKISHNSAPVHTERQREGEKECISSFSSLSLSFAASLTK